MLKIGGVTIKAIFINYISSIILPKGDDFQNIVEHLAKHSKLKSSQEAKEWFINCVDIYRLNESYIKFENYILNILKYCTDEIKFKGNILKMMQAYQNFLMYAPISNDFKQFIAQCPLPVYIVCNESKEYVKINLKRNHIHVTDIISSDMVGKSLMNRDIYAKALSIAKLKSNEVLNISSRLAQLEVAKKQFDFTSLLLDRNRAFDDQLNKRIFNLTDILPQTFRDIEEQQ